jgi:hypothetical protein
MFHIYIVPACPSNQTDEFIHHIYPSNQTSSEMNSFLTS